jgi:hypothetical protein
MNAVCTASEKSSITISFPKQGKSIRLERIAIGIQQGG